MFAVESEGQLVCGCDDGEDLSAALPAQQLLYAGIELPPDAAVLRLVGEIAGDFVTFLIGCLVFLISCLIVGMLNRI